MSAEWTMRRWIASAAGAVALIWLAAPGLASGAEITVTYTPDLFGPSAPGLCSLRNAVQTANTDAAAGGCTRVGTGTKDTILLEGGETYFRSIDGTEDLNAQGDLDITGRTKIKVVGDNPATIDGNDMDRVIEVLPGGRLKASNLIVQDGILDGPQPVVVGAGILSQGRLTLKDSTLTDNVVTTNSGCPCGGGLGVVGGTTKLKRVTVTNNTVEVNLGGGIAYLSGDLRVDASTITGNFASRGAGIYLGGGAESDSARITDTTIDNNKAVIDPGGTGGGLWVGGFGSDLELENVTISNNGANSDGGGIYQSSGSMKVNAATITENVADYDENASGDGGGVVGNSAVKLRNSVIADNLDINTGAEDCGPGPDAFGHNLVGTGTGCPTGGGNVVTTDPLLGSLADNGGPTFTHELLPGSPAIGEAGNHAPAKDQRGHKRDKHPDIGAYER